MMPLFANVVVTVLFPQPLLMLVALLLIVPVELLILRRSFAFRLKDVFAANVYSTLLGLPVAYLSLAIFGVVSAHGEPPWATVGFMSRVGTTDAHWWILPLAMIVVAIIEPNCRTIC